MEDFNDSGEQFDDREELTEQQKKEIYDYMWLYSISYETIIKSGNYYHSFHPFTQYCSFKGLKASNDTMCEIYANYVDGFEGIAQEMVNRGVVDFTFYRKDLKYHRKKIGDILNHLEGDRERDYHVLDYKSQVKRIVQFVGYPGENIELQEAVKQSLADLLDILNVPNYFHGYHISQGLLLSPAARKTMIGRNPAFEHIAQLWNDCAHEEAHNIGKYFKGSFEVDENGEFVILNKSGSPMSFRANAEPKSITIAELLKSGSK